MDTEKRHTGACKPEVGRGCAFCNCGSEPEAKLCDGCFKLHETAWLDEYPVNMPSDIVEVRFKNTRRSFYQNVNNLDLKRGDIVAVEASPGHDIGVVSLTGDLSARQLTRTCRSCKLAYRICGKARHTEISHYADYQHRYYGESRSEYA